MEKNKKQTVVIKVGTSVLLTKKNRLDAARIRTLLSQVMTLRKKGFAVILVASGAVACGSHAVSIAENNAMVRQLAAGIGQVHLIATFQTALKEYGVEPAQLLLTRYDLRTESQKKKIKAMLLFYTQNGFMPIINENDIAQLNSFGGNDLLAADIARIVGAGMLIILSTMKGSVYGVGGGQTKMDAIEYLSKEAIEAVIVNGKEKNILLQTLL